ncbi:MAG: RsmF rRNA methyltransferase first C-terminal domain-containing protein [Ferruginibacter sp.]|nr:RsmF rRNA methyltransferase first C-terminal domain-containing protein [Chitinophagaceae bacterium]
MQLPPSLLESLNDAKGFDQEPFESIHASGEQITSIRFNPLKLYIPGPESSVEGSTHDSLLSSHEKIPWTDFGYYLESRPSFTFDPLFHAGCYYVQEASSMFLEQALKQTIDLSKPVKILDLCAAPGGKSTHIHSLISKDSLLVSNEVIRSRANVLKDNIIKWGCENVIVTNNDPKDFSRLENYFDVIVADAPCSGSGLFRRDPGAIEEWSDNNVELCSQRQQRILADCWPALKKNGVLIYSTCSYSRQEDEKIVEWMTDNFPAENLLLDVEDNWGIVASGGGYRFWPDKVKGEGFFLACLQKKEGEAHTSTRIKSRPDPVNKKETEIIGKWIKTVNRHFIKHLNTVYAWPEQHADDFSYLLEQLRVIYSGVLTGELVRDKLVPAHALAMSKLIADTILKTELVYPQAIRYLQRKDLQTETVSRGWQLTTFNNHPLGWINILPNRINNYYPKELRILKDI